MGDSRYGFGSNQQYSLEVRGANKFGNGATTGSSISTQQYALLNNRALKLGMDLNTFINFLNQVKNKYGIEPEIYMQIKTFADANNANVDMFMPYIRRGIYDLAAALKDLQQRGVLCNANGMCVSPVASGVEEVQLDDGNLEIVDTETFNLPPTGDSGILNTDCPIPNIPMIPIDDPSNNPNTMNQEPLEKIGNGLQEQPANISEVPQQKTYPKDILTISNKYQIHPDTIMMLLNQMKAFKDISLDEYISLAINANKEGKSVLDYYKIYMANKGKVSSSSQDMLTKSQETDTIVRYLLNQAKALQKQSTNIDRPVAYGESALNKPSNGDAVGGVHLEQRNREEFKKPTFGTGVLNEANQPVYGQEKNVTSGAKGKNYTFGS